MKSDVKDGEGGREEGREGGRERKREIYIGNDVDGVIDPTYHEII